MSIKWCVICSGDYENEKITKLPGCMNSTAWLHSTIKIKLGIPEEDILYIVNEERNQIINALKEFCKTTSQNDTLIFYFCGHGVKVGGELCLFTHDTDIEYVEVTSIPYNHVMNILKRQKTKRIIAILDCCYSGTAVNMGLEIEDKNKDEVLTEGEVVLCSCSQVETSIQDIIDGIEHCVFTHTFTEVLSLGSDKDKEFLSIADIMLILRDKYKEKSGRDLIIDRKQDLDKMEIFKNMNFVRKKKGENTHGLEEIRNKMIRKKDWKVLLVKTSIEYATKGNDFGVPLGLWVLKNYIKLSMPNVVVDIFDERLIEMKGEQKNYEEKIKDYDIVGISICTCEVPKAIEKFKIAHDMGKVTVAGGIFTYSNEEYLLKHEEIDYVIPGVGTLPWVNLIKALITNEGNSSNVNVNYVFSKNNKSTTVWLSDTMPGIELGVWKEIIDHYSKYINKKIDVNGIEKELPKIDIVTSRGCNKSCNFCSVKTETGSSIIRRDIQAIKEEIDYLYSRGIRYFSIKDEDFFIHGTSRVKDIMEYCKKYSDIRFKIRMRLDTWDKYENEISIQKLRDWGVDEIQYGVESPQNDILMVLQKGISIDRKKVVDLFKKHYENGIKVNASFILGCSELENKEYYKKLSGFVMDIYDDKYLIPYLNFFTPHPTNSALNNEKYIITTNNLNYYTHKIPVAYPSGMIQPTRTAMLEAYKEISEKTNSTLYNPPIPRTAERLFIQGSKHSKQMK